MLYKYVFDKTLSIYNVINTVTGAIQSTWYSRQEAAQVTKDLNSKRKKFI